MLTVTEQFEMQAVVAYTIALAKQSPVTKVLLAQNVALASLLPPVGWQAHGIEEGQLYFSDTVQGYTTCAYPRPSSWG